MKNLVRDYWDLGLTALGGYLFSQNGGNLDLFGNYDMVAGAGLFITGSLAGCKSKNEGQDRGSRNVLAGASGMLLGSGNHPSYELGVLTAMASLYTDGVRRMVKKKGDELKS